MADLLQPKEVEITTQGGEVKTYIISKFPAVAGREIVCKYPLSGIPKLGDYAENEATMLKLMNYVAVPVSGGAPIRLGTRVLIDNHIPDWETLGKIEIEMMSYNCSFFLKGKASTFLTAIGLKIPELITQILTASLGQSSLAAKQP